MMNALQPNPLKYLDDTYLFEDRAMVLGTGVENDVEGKMGRGPFITLDHTIFYPQGGGQPSDVGVIFRPGGQQANVHFVSLVNDEVRHCDEVRHYIEPGISFASNETVILKIDQDKRLLHAKSHTAGHLIQAVVETLGCQLHAVKGYHFLDGPYVEFEGSMSSNPESLKALVNSQLATLIQQSGPGRQVTTRLMSVQEFRSRFTFTLPENMSHDRPLRVVTIEGFEIKSVPCGGTHLRNINELKSLSISKIRSKQGNVRISYNFS